MNIEEYIKFNNFLLKKEKLKDICNVYIFCELYNLHRDFYLNNKIARNKQISYLQAESLSDFCNQLIKTKKSKPQDFMQTEDESCNEVIEAHKKLKDFLIVIKNVYGAKFRDKIYKAVKLFYRKKYFCYQMDSFFTHLFQGLFLLINNIIGYDYFLHYYFVEYSIFDGTKKQLKLKKAAKVYFKIHELLK